LAVCIRSCRSRGQPRDAEHEVAFCSSPSFRPAVAVHGFRYFAAGLDWTVSDPDYIRPLCAAAGGVSMPAVSGLARLAWVTDHLFIGAAATRLLPDLIDVGGLVPAVPVPVMMSRLAQVVGLAPRPDRAGGPMATTTPAAHDHLALRVFG
jgi:hypothetical protein